MTKEEILNKISELFDNAEDGFESNFGFEVIRYANEKRKEDLGNTTNGASKEDQLRLIASCLTNDAYFYGYDLPANITAAVEDIICKDQNPRVLYRIEDLIDIVEDFTEEKEEYLALLEQLLKAGYETVCIDLDTLNNFYCKDDTDS